MRDRPVAQLAMALLTGVVIAWVAGVVIGYTVAVAVPARYVGLFPSVEFAIWVWDFFFVLLPAVAVPAFLITGLACALGLRPVLRSAVAVILGFFAYIHVVWPLMHGARVGHGLLQQWPWYLTMYGVLCAAVVAAVFVLARRGG